MFIHTTVHREDEYFAMDLLISQHATYPITHIAHLHEGPRKLMILDEKNRHNTFLHPGRTGPAFRAARDAPSHTLAAAHRGI